MSEWQPSWNWVDGIVPHIPVLQAGGCNSCRQSVFHSYKSYEPMRECCWNKSQFTHDCFPASFYLWLLDVELESCRYG